MALLERELNTGAGVDVSAPMRRKFTRDEYHAMDRAGVFLPAERTELIDGEVYIRMSPIGAEHIFCVNALRKALGQYDSDDGFVVTSSPAIVSDLSEPEPDIMILRGTLRDYAKVLPTMRDVLLVVEISNLTLAFDKTTKRSVYAEAGIPEYWIVNLRDRVVEMYRNPQASGIYTRVGAISEDGSVTPLCNTEAMIAVASILP